MKLNTEPIRRWFGFTRRERRSSFILLFIVFLIIAFRYTIPEKNIGIEDISTGILSLENTLGTLKPTLSSDIRLFSFDPNNASYDTLLMLGFSSGEASTLINYRNKGGKFRQPSDLNKIYGIEEHKVNELVPFVKVNLDIKDRSIDVYGRQQKKLIDLNSCDSLLLETLPGIGPVLSVRIIKYRNLLRGFVSVDQLQEVYGLPEETFNLIKGRFFIDTTIITKIDVNSAAYNEFNRLPYFEYYEVTAILKYRELMGRIEGIDDLIYNRLLTAEKAAKVRPYLSFEK